MIDRIAFILGEATTALRRNVSMTLAAITTSAVALFILGSLVWAYVGLGGLSRSVADRLDIRVFLRDGAAGPQVSGAAKALRAIPGVTSVSWIPRDKAWARYKKTVPAAITRDVENPFPHAFKLTVDSPGRAKSVAVAAARVADVEPEGGVRYLEEESLIVEQVIGFLRWLGLSVGGLLLVTSAILIYNTIRMTVLARALELRVMRLVGASWFTVRAPYLVEGMVTGTMGGLLATGLVAAGHAALQNRLMALSALSQLPPLPLLPWAQSLCAAGAMFGLACSFVAVNRRVSE